MALLCLNFSFGQILSNDCSSLSQSTWTFNSITQNSGYWLFDASSDEVITETIDLCAYSSLTLTSNLRSYGSGTPPECTIKISDDNGANWTAASTTLTSIPNTYTDYNFNFGPITSTTVQIRWTKTGGTRGLRINNIELIGVGGGSYGSPADRNKTF